MELKPGYKQTEVGVIPEDWDVSTLNGKVTITHGFAFSSRHFSTHGPFRLTTPGHFFERGGFREIGEKQKYFTGEVPTDYILRSGDMIVAMTEQSDGLLGSAAFIPDADNYLHNQRLGRVRTISLELDPGYLYCIFNSTGYRTRVRETAAGTKVKHTSPRKLLEIPVQLAPIAEQREIAQTLKDLEELLDTLEDLIAKKNNIKQAAMQELLTGKRRLPGFEGEWEVKRLGDEIQDLEAGVSVRSTTDKDQPSTGRYILKTSAVSQGQFSPTERKEIISCDSSRAKTSIKAGDLIISRMNTPALVGECGYSHSDHPNLFLPDRLWRAAYRDPKAVSSRWLSYTLSTQQNRTRIKELATGTSGSMKNISKRALLDLEIKWPSLAEQNAIAEVLSEMDDDIDAINAQLEKAQGVKQGMMQQLLTGKIRLI